MATARLKRSSCAARGGPTGERGQATSRGSRTSADGRPCYDSPTSSIPVSGPGAGSRSATPATLPLLVDFAEAILQPLAFLAVGRVGEPVADLVLGAFESLATLAERLLFAPALVA